MPRVRERFYARERRSVPMAKEFTRSVLADWGITERADQVLLCVSELATNALLHGVPPGRGFLLRLCLDGEGGPLRIEVHDSGDGHPRIPDAAEREESGRGLLLVEALSDKWGVAERDPGKIVWCEFATCIPVLKDVFARIRQRATARVSTADVVGDIDAARHRDSA